MTEIINYQSVYKDIIFKLFQEKNQIQVNIIEKF